MGVRVASKKDRPEDEFTGREMERERRGPAEKLRMPSSEDKEGKSGKGLTTEILRASADQACRLQQDTAAQGLF